MKILHIIQRYAPAIGGSETWCREVASYAQRHGGCVRVWTIGIVSEREFGHALPQEERSTHLGHISFLDGVEIHRFRQNIPSPLVWHLMRWLDRRLGVYAYPPHSLPMYQALWSAVRWADVVHLHTLPYAHVAIGYVWARLLGRPVVITPHFHVQHPSYERWLFRALLRHCDQVLVMTDLERRHLIARGVPSPRLRVIGNGVEPSDYPETQAPATNGHPMTHADERRVLFLGRKEEYKGLPTLLQAFQAVRRRVPEARLYLVGPRTEWFRQFWDQCADTLKVGVIEIDRVSHDAKVWLLRRAHVLVLPSRFEAFGIVLLEAWLCGVPVVVPEGGAPAEVAQEGGLTFRLDDADDLASQLAQLLQDPARRRLLAERGRARVLARHTTDHVGAATVEVYWRALRRRRRVLVVSHLYAPDSYGGAEVIAEQDVRGLRRRGYEVRVFCGRIDHAAPQYALSTRVDATIVRVALHTSDFMQREKLNHRNAVLERQFARCVEAFHPDVVQFHNVFALTAGLVDVCRQRRIPTIMTLHDYWPLCLKNVMLTNADEVCRHHGLNCFACQSKVSDAEPVPLPARNTLMKLALRDVDRFLAPARYLGERFVAHGFPPGRLRVVPYGIDLRPFQRAARRRRLKPGGAPVIVAYLGYLGLHKGVEYLVRAAAQVRRKDRIRILVAGGTKDVRYAAYLQALIRQLSLEGIVHLVPGIPHARVARWYHQIDVLVLPSIWPENQPVTILEAMASGLPVIASAVGGVPEMIRHGETGWLVPRADAQALADAMDRLVDDPGLRERIGRQAALAVRAQASLEARTSAIEQVTAEVIAGVKAPPVVVRLVACAGFKDGDPSLAQHLELWRAYTTITGDELPDVCDPDFLTDDVLREAKALVVPAWQARFADSIQRAIRGGVPIVGPEVAEGVPRWVSPDAVIRLYGAVQTFVRELTSVLKNPPAIAGEDLQEIVTESAPCLQAR